MFFPQFWTKMGNHWCDSPRFIPRFMKSLFNSIPPVPRYVWSWAVSYVVEYFTRKTIT